MNVIECTVGPFASNCFICYNADREALVIDPGAEDERIIALLHSEKLTPKAILITHGHMDHISALAAVHGAFPCPIAMHPTDQAWAFAPTNQMLPYYETPAAPPEIERDLAEGQTWTDAGFDYEVWELPGHAPGHVGFYFRDRNILFSGDVLFQHSVGRTDLPGGDARQLTASLRRLATLPPETTVYCGHGPHTTIGDELKHNPYMQALKP